MSDEHQISNKLKCPTCKEEVATLTGSLKTWYLQAAQKLEEHFEENPECRP